MSAFGTKLPFAALQHYVGYWGYSGLNADGTLGPFLSHLRHSTINLVVMHNQRTRSTMW
jgi:hypothetical protein